MSFGGIINGARGLLRWLVVLGLTGGAAAAWSAPFAGVMFDDSPAWPPNDLLPAYGERLGSPLDDELARQLALDLIELYQRRGYLAPAPRTVRVHDQAGILVMEMREAHVARVHLDGRQLAEVAELRPLIAELRAMRPLSLAGFDDWLRRANGFGFDVRGSLVRLAAGSPEYLASLAVTGRRWQGVLHVDNRGPAQLGHEIAQASLLYRWPREALGHLRVDAATAMNDEGLRYAGISGGHRLREQGDRLHWSYARSTSTLPIPGTSRTVDYQRERAEVRLQKPLVTRLRQRSSVSLALRSYDLDQRLDDGRPLRRDRIRAAEIGYELRAAAPSGARHTLELTLSRGLDGLGATLSPPGAEQDFTVVTGRYRYSRKLQDRWKLWGDLQLQASGDRLPSSERFFIGGRSLGGAFDPATLSGDQGLGARFGLDRELTVGGRNLTSYAYYDHGYVWSQERTRPADDAGSIGVGARGDVGKLSWSLELGVPARDPETPTLLDDDPRLFFSLTQRF